LNVPTATWKSFDALKRPQSPRNLMRAPTPIALKSCCAASAPRCPALWISEAATDSGKGRDVSSTITRRRIVTNRMPRKPPRIMRAVAVMYSFASQPWNRHIPRMTNAGIVKIAPAATDSPIDPTVRAKFSSRRVPLKMRRTAIPMTAAGYVAAIVMPAFRPR
jgi:hypothetical protein